MSSLGWMSVTTCQTNGQKTQQKCPPQLVHWDLMESWGRHVPDLPGSAVSAMPTRVGAVRLLTSESSGPRGRSVNVASASLPTLSVQSSWLHVRKWTPCPPRGPTAPSHPAPLDPRDEPCVISTPPPSTPRCVCDSVPCRVADSSSIPQPVPRKEGEGLGEAEAWPSLW